MWLVLKEGFLSIVYKDCAPDELLVRARVKEHILRYFPNAGVVRSPRADYLYRAVVPRDEVARVVSEYVMNEITTGNFKASVTSDLLHGACMSAWSAFAEIQEIPPWSGFRGKTLNADFG